MTMDNANLTTVDEHKAAEMLGLRVPTLRKWRWAGTGPKFLKVGRLVRYRLSDLKEFLDGVTVKPREA